MTPDETDRIFNAFRISCGIGTIILVFIAFGCYLIRVLTTIKHKLQNTTNNK